MIGASQKVASLVKLKGGYDAMGIVKVAQNYLFMGTHLGDQGAEWHLWGTYCGQHIQVVHQ